MRERRTGSLSDADVQRIAREMIKTLQLPVPDDPAANILAQRHELDSADEDRVSDAILELFAKGAEFRGLP